jgi:putative endonuclease
MQFYVYILTNKRNGTLYIGVTNDLIKRVFEHKEKLVEGFSKKYDIGFLVYFESTSDVNSAIQREKQIKRWNRAWKLRLIEKDNPHWEDLYSKLIYCAGPPTKTFGGDK